jgi:hypothetical protein
MYILAKDMNLIYDADNELVNLLSFFTKPYGPFQDFDPPFISSNFNNYRPVQMYV